MVTICQKKYNYAYLYLVTGGQPDGHYGPLVPAS